MVINLTEEQVDLLIRVMVDAIDNAGFEEEELEILEVILNILEEGNVNEDEE
jgi:hypothetical protein